MNMKKYISRTLKHFYVAIVIPLLALPPKCGAQSVIEVEKSSRDFAARCNSFGLDVLKNLSKRSDGSNLIISPYGGAVAVAMSGIAAEGETRAEIMHVLHSDDTDSDELWKANQKLLSLSALSGDNQAFEVANSIWFNTDVPVNHEFVAALLMNDNTLVSNVDFGRPHTRTIINDWCGAHTHGKISEMITGAFPGDLQMLLLNATFFKANWEVKFDPKLTREEAFKLKDGREIICPMMKRNGHFQYQETADFQAVYLPYAASGFGMYIVLPKGYHVATLDLGGGKSEMHRGDLYSTNLISFVDNLSLEEWNKFIENFNWRTGTIELPKFKVQDSHGFTETLQKLGMRRAFSQEAEFSRATKKRIHLDNVFQKVFVQVEETGTEAAAITAGISSYSVETSPFIMKMDHPFFFVIIDRRGGMMFFLGTIWDPES
jgi:serpin B